MAAVLVLSLLLSTAIGQTSQTALWSFPTAFPRFSSTSTFASFGSWAPAKKVSVYNPNPVPPDPTADPALAARLTNFNDLKIKDIPSNGQLRALYDQGSFRNFNMEITPDNIAMMTEDPSQEMDVHCRITTDYNTPEAKTFTGFGIGCRYKGSVGSLRVCLDEYHRENGGCRKLSIRVDANAFKSPETPKTSFYGAKSLIFNGMAVDWSLMSERTAYNLLGDLGVVAPMASHAKLFLNGKYLGVYAFVQAIDGAFAESRFSDQGKGTLYKDVWLNPVHMKKLEEDSKKEDPFMKEVMAAIEATPINYASATAFFDKYFNVNSLVDSTAFNTVIGNSDDWRQRHNFFWYVDKAKYGKKLTFIPWDYDRLYDEMAATRGPLKGRPWWKIQETTTGGICSKPIFTPEQMAAVMGGSPAMIAYNTDIWKEYPPDLEIPVSCDKITQLMAVALGPRIRARTLEFTRKIQMSKIRKNWETWTAQIQAAVAADPDGPGYSQMISEQRKLENHLVNSMSKAAAEASSEPLSSGLGTISSSTPSFAASTTFAAPAPSFTATSPAFAPVATSSVFAPAAGTLFAPATTSSVFAPAATSSVFAPAATSVFAPATSSVFAPFSSPPLSFAQNFPGVGMGVGVGLAG